MFNKVAGLLLYHGPFCCVCMLLNGFMDLHINVMIKNRCLIRGNQQNESEWAKLHRRSEFLNWMTGIKLSDFLFLFFIKPTEKTGPDASANEAASITFTPGSSKRHTLFLSKVLNFGSSLLPGFSWKVLTQSRTRCLAPGNSDNHFLFSHSEQPNLCLGQYQPTVEEFLARAFSVVLGIV